MNIIVCVKQVPNTNEVKINKDTGTLIREGIPSIINPDDRNAIEEALAIKDGRSDVTITVISMGPPQAEVALRETLSMGVDKVILLTDRAFAGSDTWATATILAAAIEKIGDYDLVLCGRQAIDGDTAQVGPEIAEFLGIPQITYASHVETDGIKVTVRRVIEEGYFLVESPLPVLLTAIKELNDPRLSDARLIHRAYSEHADFVQWNAGDIGVDLSQIGVKNSPTNVYRSFVPVKKFESKELEGTAKEKAASLVRELRSQNLL